MQDISNNNKPKKRTIQSCYEKHKQKWWFKLIGLIFIVAFTAFLTNKIFPPKIPNPDIKIIYEYVSTIPYKSDSSRKLRFDYEGDEDISGLRIFIHNQGDRNDKNFEFKISTKNKDIKLEPARISPDPSFLHVFSKNSENDCYGKLENFAIDVEIYVEIPAKTAIEKGDINFEFLSDHSKWTAKEGEIKIKRRRWFFGSIEIFKKAFAEQAQNEANQKKTSSGVLIGGYDPLIMTNNLFRILQEEELLTREQAQEIKTIVEAEKKGVLFGGVNILKFNEVAVNALIRNYVFSKREALDILQKAKDAGGVLVGGYNIIVLEVEILNLLVKKGELDLHKAQSAVDNAKRVDKKSPK